MQQVMQTLESVTYYRMRLVKSLYDKLGTLAAPSIASFTACDKPRNLSAQCVCPETAGSVLCTRRQLITRRLTLDSIRIS
jgi:hypothetical protein